MASWEGIRGKRVLLTGATHGIGLAAGEALAGLGAKLAIVARSEGRGRDAAARIRAKAGGGDPVDVLIADLSSQVSVRRLAAEVLQRYPRLDALVNNAGAMYGTRQVTEEGVERTWALNHLAPFLLTTLLLDRLRESAPARIVTTSSGTHLGARIPFEDLNAERRYHGIRRYGETKLANILFTRELSRRLEGSSVSAYAFTPGFVDTGFARDSPALLRAVMAIGQPFARRPEKGAETLVWLLDSPEVEGQSGGYFMDKRPRATSADAQDPALARRLWEVSEEQVRRSG